MAIDWAASDERLYAASVAAIRRFAAEHPDEAVCFFAFDTEPRYGYVLIGLDTLADNMRSVKRLESFAVEEREKMLRRADAWEHAKYFLSSPVLTAFNTNSGDFAYCESRKGSGVDLDRLGRRNQNSGSAAAGARFW